MLLLTDLGAQKLAAAGADGGSPLQITEFAVGQGIDVDFSTRLDKQVLVSKRYQGAVQSVVAQTNSPNTYEITCIVPANVGGFVIRELGLVANDGTLMWVGSLPEVEKPDAASGGTPVDYRIKAVISISNGNAQLVVNSDIFVVTSDWVTDNFAGIDHNHNTQYAPAGHNHDDLYYTQQQVDDLLAGQQTPASDTLAITYRCRPGEGVSGTNEEFQVINSKGLTANFNATYKAGYDPGNGVRYHYDFVVTLAGADLSGYFLQSSMWLSGVSNELTSADLSLLQQVHASQRSNKNEISQHVFNIADDGNNNEIRPSYFFTLLFIKK